LYPANNNVDRTSSYPHYSAVPNLEGLEFPMKLGAITKFETLNDISVNVFGLEMSGKNAFNTVPVRLTKTKRDKHVNLLLIQDKYYPKLNDYDTVPDNDDEDVDIKCHYCWIKDLSRLVSFQITKTKRKNSFVIDV